MANQVKFVIFEDVSEQYRWRLVAGNGEIVATSEAYTTYSSALRSANHVKEIASTAVVLTTVKV